MKRIKFKNGNYKEIHYYDAEETKIKIERYYNSKDDYHRLDGPTYIRYHESGEIACKIYIVNNKYHRLNGPSSIWYSESGKQICEYYINGEEYSRYEFNKHPEVIKFININRNLKLLNKV